MFPLAFSRLAPCLHGRDAGLVRDGLQFHAALGHAPQSMEACGCAGSMNASDLNWMYRQRHIRKADQHDLGSYRGFLPDGRGALRLMRAVTPLTRLAG